MIYFSNSAHTNNKEIVSRRKMGREKFNLRSNPLLTVHEIEVGTRLVLWIGELTVYDFGVIEQPLVVAKDSFIPII